MATWTTPPVPKAFAVVASADLTTVSADLTYLRGDTTWNAPTLINSFTNKGAPYLNVGYRLIGDLVYLRGALTGGPGSSNVTAFTLPTGYRPAAAVSYPAAVPSVPSASAVLIDTSGNVKITPVLTANTLCLDGVFFSITA